MTDSTMPVVKKQQPKPKPKPGPEPKKHIEIAYETRKISLGNASSQNKIITWL